MKIRAFMTSWSWMTIRMPLTHLSCLGQNSVERARHYIGNPTDKRVWYFLNHWYQRVGRCVLLNHHEWRECNDRNEWWFSRTHRPTSWLKWFRKYHTSLRWDFLLIQGLKPWIIRFDFSLIQHDFSWFRVISSWFQLIQGDFSWFRMISIWFHV